MLPWYYTLIGNPRLIAQKSLLVIDELQTVGDKNRGDRLEALITLVRTKAPTTQIIGLSATFPNADAVAKWLEAGLIAVTRRPVPLVEEIWSSTGTASMDRDKAAALTYTKVTHSSLDTIDVVRQIERDGHLPAIVFCVTKDEAESLARAAAQAREPRPDAQLVVNELDEVSESNPTIRALRQVLPRSIAFHNANLGHDERRLVESAFRSRTVNLLFATSTLSAGVNLPAKTVVFDTCYRRWAQEYISTAEYLNMAGRAGRRGLQESGRSVLLARDGSEFERYKRYLLGSADTVESALVGPHLDRVLLQVTAGGVVGAVEEVELFLKSSLHGSQYEALPESVKQQATAAVERLQKDDLIAVTARGKLQATQLGSKVARTGVLPSTGAFLFSRLAQASAKYSRTQTEHLERQILLLATACPDLSPSEDDSILMFVHRMDNVAELRSHLGEFAGLVNETLLEEPDRALLSAVVAYRYICMDTYADLGKLGRYASAANVRKIAGACCWMLQAAAQIEEARGPKTNPEFRKWLRRMATWLEFGATDSSVELLRIARFGDVHGLGRTRAERLAQKGFHDLGALLAADPKQLVACVDSWERVQSLRTAVVRYLGDRAQHNQVGHANRAIRLSRDARIINDFYGAQGLAFNRAVLLLLQTVFPNVREQDISDESEPDLGLPIPDGLIAIECKAKEAKAGTLGLNEAFAVLTKAAHLKPAAYITIGKPAFDRMPADRAAEAGVVLVPHAVLCEGVIRVWEGVLTADQLLTALRQVGLLEKEDLDALKP